MQPAEKCVSGANTDRPAHAYDVNAAGKGPRCGGCESLASGWGTRRLMSCSSWVATDGRLGIRRPSSTRRSADPTMQIRQVLARVFVDSLEVRCPSTSALPGTQRCAALGSAASSWRG